MTVIPLPAKCPNCHGDAWHRYLSETADGALEEAFHLCDCVEQASDNPRPNSVTYKAMEFPEYSAATLWGEHSIASKPEEDPEHPGVCWVSHPDAGGRCEKPIIYAVYGMGFCEAHGLEAAHAALAELCQSGAEELERPNNPHVPALNPAMLDIVRDGRSKLIEKGSAHEESADEAAVRAFPEVPERVDPDTIRWNPEDPHRRELPHDFWANERRLVCKLMRIAHEERSPMMIEALEPLRERATAQFVFARADYSRKVGK